MNYKKALVTVNWIKLIIICILLLYEIVCKFIDLKCEFPDGTFIDIPITFAPSILSQSESQEPLNPVCPVTITVLFWNVFFNSL